MTYAIIGIAISLIIAAEFSGIDSPALMQRFYSGLFVTCLLGLVWALACWSVGEPLFP
jgi:hypothetical protein